MISTSPSRGGTTDALSGKRLDNILARLAQNKRVRRALPGWGRLHIDRQLPFLCLYRKPADRADPGTDRLCVSEAAYLLASGERGGHEPLRELVRRIAEMMVDRFGAFLVLELWSGETAAPPPGSPPTPAFTLHRHPGSDMPRTVDGLVKGLRTIKTSRQRARVALQSARRLAPEGLRPLFSRAQWAELGDASLPRQADGTGSPTHHAPGS